MNPLESILNLLRNIGGTSTYKYDYRQPAQAVATATPSPSPIPSPMPQSNGGLDKEILAQKIAQKWGPDTPILKNLDLLVDAGNQLPANMDKLLPIILALRETQGGKDLADPRKNRNLGKNNIYNIRNDQGVFQDYPDLQTAVLGNLGSGGESSGLVGLLSGAKPSNQGIYADFRKTGDPRDLYKRWSPTEDNNGSLEEQLRNHQWFKNYLGGR